MNCWSLVSYGLTRDLVINCTRRLRGWLQRGKSGLKFFPFVWAIKLLSSGFPDTDDGKDVLSSEGREGLQKSCFCKKIKIKKNRARHGQSCFEILPPAANCDTFCVLHPSNDWLWNSCTPQSKLCLSQTETAQNQLYFCHPCLYLFHPQTAFSFPKY